jgi:hypothetical protein
MTSALRSRPRKMRGGMEYKSTANSVIYRSGDNASVVWFISFGDLLTLLLCFFLCLTPWDRLGKESKSESHQAVAENPQTVSSFGTSFASKARRVSKIVAELPVFEMADGQVDLATVRHGVMVAPRGDKHLAVTLKVCEPTVSRQSLLEVLGQEVKALMGVDARIEFEVLGSCEGSSLLAPVTEKVVAAIRIVET